MMRGRDPGPEPGFRIVGVRPTFGAMLDPSWISLLPALLAIVLAIWTRQVYLSLAGGVWLGWAMIEGWNPATGAARAIEETIAVLGSPDNTRVILFALFIGALIATIEVSGGVKGFVGWLERREWVTGPRGAQLLAYVIGLVIFIESNITILVSGSVARPLADRHRTSREKLAYIIDTTSAAICILIPLNAWGAYVLGILTELGVADPMGAFLAAIPLNFYALAAVTLAGITIATGLDLGPMKAAERRTREEGRLLWDDASPMLDPEVLRPETEGGPGSPLYMVVPIAAMVLMMPVGLYITGDGDLRAGSGSTSVLWAVLTGLVVAWIMILGTRRSTADELTRVGLRGAGGLINMATVLWLSLALADVTDVLGAGQYVAQVTAGALPPAAFLPLVFLVAAFVAFATGTSWGTFAIMLPIAVPAAMTLGWPVAPFVAASLAGGIFGDHSSPISDTTIIASMAAATDHIDHVRTQLPYALIGGAVAVVGYAVVGMML
ncbi:MAG: Na+/H+ antiporter NhaC family protein [Gemmatimonadota bacterium]